MVAPNYQRIIEGIFDKRFPPLRIRQALEGGLDKGVRYGQSIAKVRSGDLKAGITSEMVSDTEGKLISKVPYSKFVNDGTWKMSGDQYFDKTVEVTSKSIKENLVKL